MNLTNDVVVEIYRRASPLVTIAMHSVCVQWNVAVTLDIFYNIAKYSGAAVASYEDALDQVRAVSERATESVSKLPGLPLIRYAFASSILIRRLSHTGYICNNVYAATGGNLDVIERFTHGFKHYHLRGILRTAAKHQRDAFYYLLKIYTLHCNVGDRNRAVSRAVRLGGADAATRIHDIAATPEINEAIYIGALQRGDADLAAQYYTEISTHRKRVAVCKSGNVDLAKVMLSHHQNWIEYAVYYGHVDLIKYLMSVDLVYPTDDYHKECFTMACAGGRIAAVDLILPRALQKHTLGQLLNAGLCGACNRSRTHIIKYLGKLGATICDNCGKHVDEHVSAL